MFIYNTDVLYKVCTREKYQANQEQSSVPSATVIVTAAAEKVRVQLRKEYNFKLVASARRRTRQHASVGWSETCD